MRSVLPLLLVVAGCDFFAQKDAWLENAKSFEAEGNYLGALDAYKKSSAYGKGDLEVARRVDRLERFRPDFEQAWAFEQQTGSDPKEVRGRYEAAFARHGFQMAGPLKSRLDKAVADRAGEADRMLARTRAEVQRKLDAGHFRDAAAASRSFPAAHEPYVSDPASLRRLKDEGEKLERFLPDYEKAQQFEEARSGDPRAVKQNYAGLFRKYDLAPPDDLIARLDAALARRVADANQALADAHAEFQRHFHLESYPQAAGAVRSLPAWVEGYASDTTLFRRLKELAVAADGLPGDLEAARGYERAQPGDPRGARERYLQAFAKHRLEVPLPLRTRLEARITERTAEADRAAREAAAAFEQAVAAYDWGRAAAVEVPAWVDAYATAAPQRLRQRIAAAGRLSKSIAEWPAGLTARDRFAKSEAAHREAGLAMNPATRRQLLVALFNELQAAWREARQARQYRTAVAVAKWIPPGETVEGLAEIQKEAALLEPYAPGLDFAVQCMAARKWGSAWAALRPALGEIPEAAAMAETCAARGSRIAYESLREDEWDVWTTDSEGSREERLARSAESADWAPDGARLAFVSTRDGNREIYAADPSGATRRLTRHPKADRFPAWSPDGTRIAFVSDREGKPDLYVMDADGGNVARLTQGEGSNTFPCWSPDGKWLAFVSERDGNTDVYAMHADGSNVARLTTGDRPNTHPAWSPEGRKIAFVSERDGNAEVYVMNFDGSDPVRLTRSAGADGAPAWSPDGLRIVFVSERDGNSEIYVMNADGKNPQRLTRNESWDTAPAWSPPRDEN